MCIIGRDFLSNIILGNVGFSIDRLLRTLRCILWTAKLRIEVVYFDS